MAQSVIFAGLWETFINIHCTSLPWNTESPDVRQWSRGNGQKAQRQSCSAWTAQHLPGHLTFPARGTLAGVAFRVRRFLANSWVLTRIRGTRSNHHLAVQAWRAEREKILCRLLRAWCFLEERIKPWPLAWLPYTAVVSFSVSENCQQEDPEIRALLMGSVVQEDGSQGNSEFNTPSTPSEKSQSNFLTKKMKLSCPRTFINESNQGLDMVLLSILLLCQAYVTDCKWTSYNHSIFPRVLFPRSLMSLIWH